jgi:SNF2 family DNA or RNA helicase
MRTVVLTSDLYPYQSLGVDQFLDRGNLLVAGGTGVGKTVMTIGIAEELLGREPDEGRISTSLIVVPATLKYQWAQKIAAFTDIPTMGKKVKSRTITIPQAPYCVVIDGTPQQRDKQYDSVTSDTDYVICGYSNILDDTYLLEALGCEFIVIDEASAIKNPGAQITQCMKALFMSEYRLALTATPVENKPEELFSIMEWIDPEILGRWEFFEKTYVERHYNGRVTKYKSLPVLHARVAPAMWRKTRNDPEVAPFFPEIDEDEWYVPMDDNLHKVYNHIALDLYGMLKSTRKSGKFDASSVYTGGGKLDEGTKVGALMARHQALEMLLDHPDLLVHSAIKYEEGKGHGSKYCYQIWQDGVLDDLLESQKCNYLRDKVAEILAFDDTSKILIFTRFVPMLDIIEDILDVSCVQYHGGMNASAKAAATQRFTEDPDCRVFLSSHAGAYGCDMYMANYLINLDQHQSAGGADQINGRHDRPSSEFKHVFIRNLVTEDSIEERNMMRLDYKRKVAAATVDGKGADRMGRVYNDLISLTSFLENTLDFG